jgi:coproporphyrinogen III oxidase-like Fe-S oxidoreductase
MKMNMFAVYYKVKPDIEYHIRGINLEVVKPTTIQVTEQPLQHNINKLRICEKYALDERPSIFITDKAIFSSQRKLCKDLYGKGSVEETNLWSWVSRGLMPRQIDWR